MPSPVVDITTLYAVESLFRPGTKDPWAPKLAGRLADLFIYSETGRYTMPIGRRISTVDDPSLPPVLRTLSSRDRDVFAPLAYFFEDRPRLDAEHLEPAFQSFAEWASNKRRRFKQWVKLHREIRDNPGDISHVRAESVFDVGALSDLAAFHLLASELDVRHDDLRYAFDIILRYPLYGQLAGAGSYFLAHPIREEQGHPIISVDSGASPDVPISLSLAVAAMAPSMTLDEYTSFLHEARGFIRDRRINRMSRSAIDVPFVREVAAELGIPAKLNNLGRVAAFAAGVVGTLGAVPAAAPVAAVAGGLITLVPGIWSGNVGRRLSRVSWLKWALKWDLESEAIDGSNR
jgi:hypothetical protein